MSILRKASQNGIEYTSDDVLNEYTDEIQRSSCEYIKISININ